MLKERIYRASPKPQGTGSVLYWMDRDMRLQDNWALLHADALAKESGQELIVAYNLVSTFLGGGLRQVSFKLGALKEIEKECAELGIRFTLLVDETGKETPRLIQELVEREKIGVVVTDFSPLRMQRAWKKELAETLPVPLVEVDTHNIVPVHIASSKKEFAAYTLRPKLHKLLPKFLEEFPQLSSRPKVEPTQIDVESITSRADASISPLSAPLPGEQSAHKALKQFIEERLPSYGTKRNDALADAQSNLSPYLHYGMIAPQRVALEVVKAVGMPMEKILHVSKNKAKVEEGTPLLLIDHASAFLEELVVRRELSDNFCLYEPDYDSPKGFPEWAQKSFSAHKNDSREYVYTQEEFEKAKTHDALWNSAQNEMVQTGKMHGYMRMYWAKKILEWTKTPEDAMRIAIYLNDRYELDGRDPNGYAGIAWSIGGVHDRAWFTRPIYGQVRYMAKSGADKKFDTKAYIEKYATGKLL